MQNILARAQLNIYKKIKVPGRPSINYIINVERGHTATINLQTLSQLDYMQNCSYNLKQLIILLYRRKLDSTNSVLSIDMALNLISLSNAP